MSAPLALLWSSAGFMPHGHCYLWTPSLVWLHAISDGLIVLAYFSIPVTLVYLVRKRRDLEFSWMFVCFATFIVACGTTHLLEIWNIWHADYWLSGVIKSLTAVSSLGTAVLLVRLVPGALALPSARQIQELNAALTQEIDRRRLAEETKDRLNAELEQRVADVTARFDLVNENLRTQMATQARLAAIVESTDDAIIGETLEGMITSWNPAAEKIFGYTAVEIIGQSILRLIPPEYTPEETNILEEIRRGKILEPFETVRLRKDGSRIAVSATISPIRDGAGAIVGVSKIARDITRRRQTEEALRESQNLYHSLVDQMPAGIFRKDAAGRYVFVNSFFHQLRGSTPESFTGKIPRELPPSEASFVKDAEAHHALIMQTGRSLEVRDKYLRPDGTTAHFHVIKSPVRAADGSVIGTQGIVMDITERVRVEDALRESEERFGTVIENMTEGLVLADLNGQILHVNRSALKLLGFPATADWIRRRPDFAHIFAVQDIDGAPLPSDRWPLARVARGELVRDLEIRLRRLDSGWQRAFSYNGALVRQPGGRTIAFLTLSDITRRKQGEEEIRRLNTGLEQRVAQRTAELETANKELEAFSYSVSHDLRAPLRGIDGFSRIVQEDYADKLDAEGGRLLGIISQEAQRMGRLIDDLLRFSRMSRQPLETSFVNMTELAQDVFHELVGSKPPGGLRFELLALPPARGDLSMLRQVLVNLIGNALKFSSGRPDPSIQISGSVENEWIVYHVKDNGAGFDEKFGAKLFGVFQRLHSEKEFAGTGVGLALVQRIVHRHGGKAWATSQVGQGADFYFRLPAPNPIEK